MSGLLPALCLALVPARLENRGVLADVVLEGPCAAVELDLGSAGSTRIEGPLAAGERRTRTVPLPAFGRAPHPAPEVRVLALERRADSAPAPEPGQGSARFAGWRAGDDLARDLPPALLARPLPPVPAVHARARAAELLLLAGAFLLAAALSRRAAWALAVSLAAAPALYGLARSAPREAALVRVLEGDAASGRWLQVDAAPRALAVPPQPGFELVCEPARRPLRWSVPRDAAAPWIVADREGSWTTRLVRRGELRTARSLSRARNGWGDLERAWLRDPAGAWWRLGAWPEGAPLPAPERQEAPPGWLASGLPQGVAVVLARLAPEAFAGEGTPPGDVFLRLAGL